MRRIIPISLIGLLLTACTIGIVRQDQIPRDASVSPTPDIAATADVIVMTRVAATVIALRATPIGTSTPTRVLPPPTVTLPSAHVPTSPTVPPPAILSFSVKPTEINPGESVTLTWAATGAVRTTLRRMTALGGSFEIDVPFSGSRVVESEKATRHWNSYELTTYNSAGITTTRSLTVRIHCATSFFFTTDSLFCPNEPAQSSWAAEQVFEGGRMLWLEQGSLVDPQYKGQSLIFVLYTSGNSWELYVATWTPTEPDSDPSIVPPQGFYQPIRGFGKIWRNNPQVQKRLGWALVNERGFETLYQRVSGIDWDNQCYYLQTVDGRVISLCSRGGVWSFVTP